MIGLRSLSVLLLALTLLTTARGDPLWDGAAWPIAVDREIVARIETPGRVVTTVQLVLSNPTEHPESAEVRLPLPENAATTMFVVKTPAGQVIARMKERQQACAIFNSARSAYMLEMVAPATIRVSIARIQPQASATVRITYETKTETGPTLARKQREQEETLRRRTALPPTAFLDVIAANGYRPEDPAVAKIIHRSIASKTLSPFTSLLAAQTPPPYAPSPSNPGPSSIAWLAGQQAPDGSWNRDGARSPGDPGTTGLALLAFLSWGETHKTGRYRAVVTSGLDFLARRQRPDGSFSSREDPAAATEAVPVDPLTDAQAALAMIEAYALTGSPRFKGPANAILGRIARTRNEDGGWSGRPGGPSAVPTTLWTLACLVAATTAGGLDVDETNVPGARAYVDSITDATTGRVAGGLTAAAALARTRLGGHREFRLALERCLEDRPDAAIADDPTGWPWVARLIRVHGRELDTGSWRAALRRTVADHLDFGAVRLPAGQGEGLGVVGTTARAAEALGVLAWSGHHGMVPEIPE